MTIEQAAFQRAICVFECTGNYSHAATVYVQAMQEAGVRKERLEALAELLEYAIKREIEVQA